jgi:hypothetical protein
MRESSPPAPSAPAVRGRPFAKGNPGRQVGSQNRITKIAAALVADQAEELIQKAIELALNGDVQILRFLLGRILPRERLLKFEIPELDSADNTVEATAGIMRDVAGGIITPAEGSALVAIFKANREAIELADVVKRIDLLEGKGTK